VRTPGEGQSAVLHRVVRRKKRSCIILKLTGYRWYRTEIIGNRDPVKGVEKMNQTGKLLFLGAMILTLLAAGCATAPPPKEENVFYPPPPALPRVQFLTSLTRAKDVEGQKPGFEAFITGIKESSQRLDKPYGIAMYEGKIYVCDTNDRVFVFDLNRNTFGPLEGGKGRGKLIQPININIDKDGTKYVTDPIRGQVVVFDRNDQYLKAIGTPGKWKPVDALPYEGRVYVADIDHSEIKVFDATTGEMVKNFGSTGEKFEAILDMPVNLAFDSKGYLYVSDAGKFQVVKFDRDGHFISTIGKLGLNVGHFQRPKGIAIDKEDRIFVVDASFFNVQVFNRDGQNLFFFGQGGTGPGTLILPAGIAIDHDNIKYFEKYVAPNFAIEYLVLVTSQFGDRSVNVFAFGKEKGTKYPTDEELLEQLKERLLRQVREKPAEGETATEAEKPAGGN